MKPISLFFIILICIGLSPLTAAEEEAKPVPELTRLLEAYDAKSKTEVLQSHEAALSNLNANYAAALDRSLTKAQQEGKLEEALAINAEKDAIIQDQAPPSTEVPEAYRLLEGMRKTYLSTHERMEAERDRKLRPITQDLLKALDRLSMTLTKEGRLDEALIVKNRRKDFEPSAATGETEEDKGRDEIDRYFVNKKWISLAKAVYSFEKGGTGTRTHAGTTTTFTWKKRNDDLVEVLGRMAPDAAPRTWYFKFDNKKEALFGTRTDLITAPLTAF